MLETLISSKTRIKLLMRLFLNPESSAYLRGLAEEFNESTNSVRLAFNPWNIDSLERIQNETVDKVWNILQFRVHESIIALKKKIEEASKDKVFDVDLTYLTSRGHWYYTSWKGDVEKSGGIATNIGVHFYDMLGWLFGDIKEKKVHVHTHDRAAGYLEFERARVRWFLSIN